MHMVYTCPHFKVNIQKNPTLTMIKKNVVVNA